MRKSTLIVMAILLASMVVLTLAYRQYAERLMEESKHAKALTATLRDDLAPDGKVRLGRVRGGPAYVVGDAARFGVVLFAQPSEAVWKADPTGGLFGRRAALAVFEAYVPEPDRPVDWVELRLTRPDGTAVPPFGYSRGEGRQIVPVAPPGGVPVR